MFESEKTRSDESTNDGLSQRVAVSPLDPPTRLWCHIFADRRGYLALFSGARAADPKRLVSVSERYFSWPEEAGAALEHALAEAGRDREVYFCAHLLTEKRRIKENAAPVLALWVDGDGATVPPHLPQPTAVVESSPGREHFYWRLARPIPPEEAEELNKRLAYAIGADKSGWDLGQLLRVPGTPNFKYPGRPMVTIKKINEKEMKDAS
jgi:RepB DNA-primase from phage plasmid